MLIHLSRVIVFHKILDNYRLLFSKKIKPK